MRGGILCIRYTVRVWGLSRIYYALTEPRGLSQRRLR